MPKNNTYRKTRTFTDHQRAKKLLLRIEISPANTNYIRVYANNDIRARESAMKKLDIEPSNVFESFGSSFVACSFFVLSLNNFDRDNKRMQRIRISLL